MDELRTCLDSWPADMPVELNPEAAVRTRRCHPVYPHSQLVAAVWLVGQCTVFIRYREQLAMPPVSLKLNEPAVDRLSALISGWALAGLAQANVHGSRS
jgi:hypothetical protein